MEKGWNEPEKGCLEGPMKCEINKELQKAQYRDFVSVLKDLGYMKEELDTDGAASILAGVQLYRLCREENIPQKNIEDTCFNIACLIEKILRAQNVKILLECPLECDKWEDNVRVKYNDLVQQYLIKKEDDEEKFRWLRMELKDKKEYLIIADSGMRLETMEGVELRIAERLIEYRKNMEAQSVEFYADNKGYFVWEIGGDDDKRNEIRKLLIYAEFDKLSLPKDWHILRNLVCMNYMLKTTVFDTESRDYLFELILADKERLMYNMDRTHSHTASKIKSAQCELVQTEEERIGIEGCYRSFTLTLLADLQISQIYRESLKERYYCRDLIMKSRKCEDVFGVFYQERPIITLEQETDYKIFLKLCIEIPEHGISVENEAKLNKEDGVLTYNMANGGNEILLMITALIMNAAEPLRGIRESSSPNNVKEVKVYLLKSKEGCLRIMNKCREEKEVKSVNAELNYPPQGNQGISLWSVSRYVKGAVSVLIYKKLRKLEEKIRGAENCDIIRAELEEFKQILEQIWERPEFRVRAGTAYSESGDKYFYMDIPILTEKYKELLVD